MNDQSTLYGVLIAPVMTEKAMGVAGAVNQYVFKIAKGANKIQVKNAVEFLFQVKVEQVNIANIKGKNKVFRQKTGKRPDIKKAYVKLAAGHTIELPESA